jgi:hypothetical protein
MATTTIRDTWRENLLTAAFFGLQLDILNTEDEWRSSLVKHSGPRRDGASLDPMGQEPRTCRCTVIFFEREGEADDELAFDDHIARFVAFMGACTQAREPRELVHLSARAAADDPNVIMVAVDFVEDGGPSNLAFPELAPMAAGQGQVNALSDELDGQLGGIDLPDTATATPGVGAKAKALVDSWVTDVNLATRDVDAELSEFSDQVSDALLEVNAGTDLSRFPIVRTLHRLHSTLRRAAEHFRRSQPQVINYSVTAATSLRAIATSLGQSFDDLVRLNDLADPTYIPPGSTIRVLSSTPSGVQGAAALRGGRTG